MTASPAILFPGSAPNLDFLQLHYRADLHLLVGRWQRPVSAAELRQGYLAIQRLAEATTCPFWLVDVRSRNCLDKDALQWLTTEFLPALPAVLDRPVCLAYLLHPSHGRQLHVVPGDQHLGPGTRVGFFEDEGALNRWLMQSRYRVATTPSVIVRPAA